jgi:hypothetical protein
MPKTGVGSSADGTILVCATIDPGDPFDNLPSEAPNNNAPDCYRGDLNRGHCEISTCLYTIGDSQQRYWNSYCEHYPEFFGRTTQTTIDHG